jgi:hypothetical protein
MSLTKIYTELPYSAAFFMGTLGIVNWPSLIELNDIAPKA